MITQCPHETIYMGRCMCCYQKVRKPRNLRIVAQARMLNGEVVETAITDDYDETLYYFQQGTGRM